MHYLKSLKCGNITKLCLCVLDEQNVLNFNLVECPKAYQIIQTFIHTCIHVLQNLEPLQ